MNTYMIFFYVCLSILLLYAIYSCIQNNYSEHYDTNIYKNFKKSLNSANKKVRKNNFTYYKSDSNVINWVMDTLQRYNCKVYLHPNIYYGHPDLEFNYSHTMDNYIILSNNDYKLLQRYYNDNNDNVVFSVGSTIVHESLHVHQRYNYERYKELYKTWGYVFTDKIYNFNNIINYKRQNPDADDNNILWFNDGKYYFINCFYDKNNLKSNVVYRYVYTIDRDNNGSFVYKNEQPSLLKNFDSYLDYFGREIHNNYTPNEICAEYNEKLYSECINGQESFTSPAYELFKIWYKTNVF